MRTARSARTEQASFVCGATRNGWLMNGQAQRFSQPFFIQMSVFILEKINYLFEDISGYVPRLQLRVPRSHRNPWPLSNTEPAGRFEPALLEAARRQQAQDEAQMESDYLGIKPTEQAVLWRMLEQGPRYRPYDAEARQFYRRQTGHPVSVAQVQKALESLRQRMPALVWKSARGEYALEDVATHRWSEALTQAGGWPPHSAQGQLRLERDG